MRKLLLTLLLLFSAGMVAKAQGSADLSTINGGKNATTYNTYKTTNGWTATNSVVNNTKISPSAAYPVLNGKTTAVGTLTSPTLNGGVGEVAIKCVYPNSESNGMKFTLNIKQNGAVVKTQTFTSASNTTAEFTSEAFNIAGDFVIEIKAGSPSNSTKNKDRLGIYELTWTGYTAGGNEKITLDAANIVVTAGEEAIESEKELDANTAVTFSYTTDNTNADITYSYSVDGGEDVEGNSYTFTGEKDVELTVKATSENTVSKTVKLLKKYPTVCPEPVFNVEDGAKVYAGQAVTVSCEGADIEWTVNDVTITGTSYTITEEVGTQLTFYALASIEGRNPSTGIIETLMAEKEITVTVEEATEAMFDFIGGNNYGLTPQTDGGKYETALTEISNGIVTISFSGEHYRYWANDKTLRVQADTKFTINVPDEYYITNIDMTGTSASNVNTGTFNLGNWTPTTGSFDSSVIFSPTTTTKIKTITVQYAKVPENALKSKSVDVHLYSGTGRVGVTYTIAVANWNGSKLETAVEVLVGDNKVEATPYDPTTKPAAAPEMAAAENKTFSNTLYFEAPELKNADKSQVAVNFSASIDGKELFAESVAPKTSTSIEDVMVEDNETAEYFNLQGLRVAQPEAGQLYIKRQGGNAVKVRF